MNTNQPPGTSGRTNPFQGTSGRVLRPDFGGDSGQGAFDLDITGNRAFDEDYRDKDRPEVSRVEVLPRSSRVAAIRYHFEDRVLMVSWRNGKTPYIYKGVPPTMYIDLITAASVGKAIDTMLHGGGRSGGLFPGQPEFPSGDYGKYIYGYMITV